MCNIILPHGIIFIMKMLARSPYFYGPVFCRRAYLFRLLVVYFSCRRNAIEQWTPPPPPSLPAHGL